MRASNSVPRAVAATILLLTAVAMLIVNATSFVLTVAVSNRRTRLSTALSDTKKVRQKLFGKKLKLRWGFLLLPVSRFSVSTCNDRAS